MKVGAARGAGIYASPTLGVAAGYSKYTTTAQNLPNQRFLAVIEVINEKSYDKGGSIWVITREGDVRIRFYLVEDQAKGNGQYQNQ